MSDPLVESIQYDGLPMRMATTKVVIAQLRMSHTHIDKVYKESVGKEERKTITVYAQNNSRAIKRKSASSTGDKIMTAGHLVFRKKDLDDAGIILRTGDYIIELAGAKVNFEIVEIRPESILGGKQRLIYADYMAAKERSSV